VDRRDRPARNDPRKRLALPVVELGRFARRLAVNQTIRPFGVEPENPVSDDLEPYIADPRRIPSLTTIVNLGQSQKPAALCPSGQRSAGPTSGRP
jgi:hypothetical protein